MNTVTHHLPTSTFVVAAGVLAWLSAVIAASASGALAELGRTFMPAYAGLVALGIAVPTVLYFTSSSVRKTIEAVGLHRLTLMHAWRVPAALLFYTYGLRGELPAGFWILAGTGDLFAGLYAGTLLFRPPTIELYRRIHLFGFADFVVAVGTGLTFTLLGDARMSVLTTLPMALIPLFGVGLSGASHIVALTRLTRTSPTSSAAIRPQRRMLSAGRAS
ncbi:MAG: permease [Deltaproteobacteria bacterium]|nr:permease [Nannocystaceae bacterium]